MCTPFNAPQLPAQWFKLNYLSNINGKRIGKALGLSWMRNSRLTPLYHMSRMSFLKILIYTVLNNEKINEKLKLFGEQQKLYDSPQENVGGVPLGYALKTNPSSKVNLGGPYTNSFFALLHIIGAINFGLIAFFAYQYFC